MTWWAAVGVAITALAGVACTSPPTGSATAPPEFDPNFGNDVVQILPIPGGELAIFDQGTGDTVLFFYPGFDHRYWQFQLAETAKSYRAVNIHVRASEPVASPSFGAAGAPLDLGTLLISFLEPLRQQPGFDRIHFVAHSIAGRMALEAAIARPDLFATLVLAEPAGGKSAPGLAPPPASCTLESLDPAERRICIFSNLRSGPGYYESLSEPQRRYLFEGLQSATDLDVDAFASICEAIGKLTMPILFVRGAETPEMDKSRLDDYESCLPEHETAVIPGTAHNPHLDEPEAFNAVMLDFIDRHPQTE